MVKLTVELIEQAAQHTNPVRDRELDLRGAVVLIVVICCAVCFNWYFSWL